MRPALKEMLVKDLFQIISHSEETPTSAPPALKEPSIENLLQITNHESDSASTPESTEKLLEYPAEDELLLEETKYQQQLIIYNDDHNTFEHVIETLIRICKHSRMQAEQCTYLIHFKGKCCVKKGTYQRLKPMHESIIAAGIIAEII